MTEPTKRQKHPWPWYRRVWREIVWALDLDDGTGDGSASMTKGMALLFGLLTVAAIWLGKPISGTQITLATIALSAAFGRSMWRAFLQRAQFTQSASDATVRTEATVEQVQARRDPDAGYEVSK